MTARPPLTAAATAILVAFDSAAVIGRALASLPPGLPAIVVDNASRDDGAAIARAAGALVLRRQRNEGFGRANNEGLTAAETPFALLLNPDATLEPGCLEALIAVAERWPDATILVPTILKADGRRFEKWSSPISAPAFRPRPAAEDVRDIDFASGAVMLVRREAVLALRGFDPAIFLYFEDDDLSRRVLDAGHRILHVPAAAARHIGNVSSPASPRMTEMKHWHLAWSERRVRLKHRLPAWSRWRLMESAVKLAVARARGDAMEAAKQRGLLRGTRAALAGIQAQDIRDGAAG